MSENKSIIASFKGLMCNLNENKQKMMMKKRKLQNRHEICCYFMSIIPLSIMFGIFMTTSERSKSLSISYFIITFILWMFMIALVAIMSNKACKKIEDIDSDKIMTDFLQKNERPLIIEIQTCLENNNKKSQYEELRIKLENIKLDYIKKNWENIIIELPTFLDDLNNQVSKTKITEDDRKKLDNYNTLLKYELSLKEKEINYNL